VNYTGLGPTQPLPSDTLHLALRFLRRSLILASAALIALLISGGIFTFTPLIGLRIAHTSGVSMEPAYKSGDVVLIKDAGENDVHVGDIVVYEAFGEHIMHRIISMHTDSDGGTVIITRGDNVAVPDRPVRASQVSGKLIGEVPLLGTLSRAMDAQGGFYVYRSFVLSIAVFAVAVWGLVTSVDRQRQRIAARELAEASAQEASEEPED
jgi:signal peptidase I